MGWFSLMMLVWLVMMVAGCFMIIGSVGFVRERGSEGGNNKKIVKE